MDDPEEGAVGYKRPPLRTRFRPNNQYGKRNRKPKFPDPYDEFHKVMRRKITIKVAGIPQKMTIRKALLIRLRSEAQKGVRWALTMSQQLISAVPPMPEQLQAEIDRAEIRNIEYELIKEELREMYERSRAASSESK